MPLYSCLCEKYGEFQQKCDKHGKKIYELAKERNKGREPDELHLSYEYEVMLLRVEVENLRAKNSNQYMQIKQLEELYEPEFCVPVSREPKVKPKVGFCNWCPTPTEPRAANHPYGQAEHLPTPSEDRPKPEKPCGCVHYMGGTFMRCQGPHTTGTGDDLKWADEQ